MSSVSLRLGLLHAACLRATCVRVVRNAAHTEARVGQCDLLKRPGNGTVPSSLRIQVGGQRGTLTTTTVRTLCSEASVRSIQEQSEVRGKGVNEALSAEGDSKGEMVTGCAGGDVADEAPPSDVVHPRLSEERQEREAKLASIRQWLHDKLGFSETRARSISGNSAWMLGRSVEGDFEPKIQWLQERLCIRTEREAVQIVADNLFLLRLDIDEIEKALEALRKLVKVNTNTIMKMVTACPPTLVVPLEEVVRRLKWLEERLVLSETNVNRIVINQPILLASSIEKRLEPTVAWAESELRLDPQQVGVLALKYPKWMFAIARNGLDLRLRWLQTALGCTKEQAARMMSRDGRLWLLGRKNLWPKIIFFRKDLGVSPGVLRDAMVKCPMIIASNLNTRMRPRVTRMREAGIVFDFEEHQRVISLAGDETFDKWLAEAREALDSRPEGDA